MGVCPCEGAEWDIIEEFWDSSRECFFLLSFSFLRFFVPSLLFLVFFFGFSIVFCFTFFIGSGSSRSSDFRLSKIQYGFLSFSLDRYPIDCDSQPRGLSFSLSCSYSSLLLSVVLLTLFIISLALSVAALSALSFFVLSLARSFFLFRCIYSTC